MGEPIYISKRRGISTFIAVLLLIVIAVAAGVVIYAYIMGYLGNFNVKPNGGAALQIDSVAQFDGGLHLYVKNTGNEVVKIDSPPNGLARVYVNGIEWVDYEANPSEVPEGVTCEVIVKGLGLSYVGKTASVKIVSADGVMVETNVKISDGVIIKTTPLVTAPTYTPVSPVTLGSDVTVGVVVSGSNSTPTGAVDFEVSTDGGSSWSTLIPSRPLDGAGKAEYTYQPAVGSYIYRAVYSGDVEYLRLTSGVSEVLTVTSATKLIFSSDEGQFLTINVVSGQIMVQRLDAGGNPVTSDGTISVSLSATGSITYAFYLDSYETTKITSIDIPAGSSSAIFYFKDTVAGTPTIIGSSGSIAQAETTFTVSDYKLLFNKGDGQTIGVVQPSSEIIIERFNWDGSPYYPSTAVNLSLTTTSGGGKFYSDPGCTMEISSITINGGDSTSVSFYYKDMNVDNPTLTISSADYTPATSQFTVTP